ncbi:MAG: iron ABC transporter permease [Propionibacteriaceae bacterium]|jgi:iron complex transport system permease protein|nr:iron ABC transporter permease [Propionibacteriaceae bacterium]
MERKFTVWMVGAAILLVVLLLFSAQIGPYSLRWIDVWQGLTGQGSSEPALVVRQIRLPRLLAASLVGAGLAVAGAAFQALFRNPMASPDVLGASSGAGFGAALALYVGLGQTLVSVTAFIGGLVAVGVAYLISLRVRHNAILGLVLSGMIIASLFNATTSLIKLLADPNNQLPSITFWLMGSLNAVSPERLAGAALPILVGLLVLLASTWPLNLMTLGDDQARSLGVNARLLRLLVIVAATLVVAACAALVGLVGWVGLVIPHLVRLLVGADNRWVLPLSALLGASFLLVIDDLSRAFSTAEIPIGILTAFVGTPVFCTLLLRRGDQL